MQETINENQVIDKAIEMLDNSIDRNEALIVSLGIEVEEVETEVGIQEEQAYETLLA